MSSTFCLKLLLTVTNQHYITNFYMLKRKEIHTQTHTPPLQLHYLTSYTLFCFILQDYSVFFLFHFTLLLFYSPTIVFYWPLLPYSIRPSWPLILYCPFILVLFWFFPALILFSLSLSPLYCEFSTVLLRSYQTSIYMRREAGVG